MRKTRVYGAICIGSVVIGLALIIWFLVEKGFNSPIDWRAGIGLGLLVFVAFPLFFMAGGETPEFFGRRQYYIVKCPHCQLPFKTFKLRDPEINPTLECPKCKKSFRW